MTSIPSMPAPRSISRTPGARTSGISLWRQGEGAEVGPLVVEVLVDTEPTAPMILPSAYRPTQSRLGLVALVVLQPIALEATEAIRFSAPLRVQVGEVAAPGKMRPTGAPADLGVVVAASSLLGQAAGPEPLGRAVTVALGQLVDRATAQVVEVVLLLWGLTVARDRRTRVLVGLVQPVALRGLL